MNEDKRGHKAVFGIFSSRFQLENAVSSLKANDFRNSDISVLMPSKEDTQNFAHEKSTKAPEGATAGAAGGFAIGGILGWLVGVGSLAIPGIGPFVAAGPIVAALAGAGVGGAIGGLAGTLVGIGIPEYEAKRYESIVQNGGILLSVHVDDAQWAQKAREILQDCGARDISSTNEERAKTVETFMKKSDRGSDSFNNLYPPL
jgi:hypothetical protein